jgi:phosphatidylethanolamine/phosphatidyl-N-methylethanolamine N-methyltransferase
MTTADRNPQFWRKHARRYDRSVRLLNRRFSAIPAMVADDLRGTRRVLEVAAGTGLVTLQVAPAVASLVATDRSPEMLEVLRDRVKEAGLANVEVKEADVLALDFADATFDAVVAGNLLHLLPEPGKALDEIRRVLRPGGLLCTPTFAHGETMIAHGVSRLLGLAGFPVVSRFRGDGLRRLIEARRFEISREVLVGGVLPVRYVVARSQSM